MLIDLDPQGSASTWGELRDDDTPIVKSTQPPQLEAVLSAAAAKSVTRTVIDTPPHTSDAALTAGRAADLIIIPCQPATADLHAIKSTIDIARLAHRPVVVLINRALVKHPSNEEARRAIRQYGIHSCPVILH